MKKVLKVKVDRSKVVFENLPEALDFMSALEIPVSDSNPSEEEMLEEAFNRMSEFSDYGDYEQ